MRLTAQPLVSGAVWDKSRENLQGVGGFSSVAVRYRNTTMLTYEIDDVDRCAALSLIGTTRRARWPRPTRQHPHHHRQ
jgi:hypothetical protein